MHQFSVTLISELSIMWSPCVRRSYSIKCFSESAWDLFQGLFSSVSSGKRNLLVSRKSTCCWLQLSFQSGVKELPSPLLTLNITYCNVIEYHITSMCVPQGFLGSLHDLQVAAPWCIQPSLKVSVVPSGMAILVGVCRKLSGFEHFLKDQDCYDNIF